MDRIGSIRQGRLRTAGVAGLMAMLLAACGGGAGGADPGAGPEQAQAAAEAAPIETPVRTLAPLRQGTNSLAFTPDAGLVDADTLALRAGGLLAQWSPRDPLTALSPGVKVAFFGLAQPCETGAIDGPTRADADAVFNLAQSRSGAPLPAASSGLRWTPSANTPACPVDASAATGPSAVFLHPADDGSATVALYTATGPLADGGTPFFVPYGPTGVDGRGTNANGLGTFFALRRAWWAADAVRPWMRADGRANSVARIASTQYIASQSVGQVVDSNTVQVKQQIVAEFINTACIQPGSGATGPCLLQYLFNTAVYRAGVTDWAGYIDDTLGHIWYDPDQGGIPIVEGHLPMAGTPVNDSSSGLALFTSAGTSTRHASFTDAGFDVRISFEQAVNAMRVVTAAKMGVHAANVTDVQMATVWGARWNDASVWTLVHATVGQEVYNQAYASRNAWIGGGFRQLYVASLD